MLLILQNLETNKSFEVAWIYNRGSGSYFLLINDAKDKFQVGSEVILSKYAPKLEKKVKTTVVEVETNPVNKNLLIALKDKKSMPFFKQALTLRNQS